MRPSHLLIRNERHRVTIVQTRVKANGNFSGPSVERFHSVRINRMMSPINVVDLDCPYNSLYQFQVFHRYVFIVV